MDPAQAAVPNVEIKLLGSVELSVEGRPLGLGRRKQRAMLALLALNANRVVSTDSLIDALWGESPPPTASVASTASSPRFGSSSRPTRPTCS